jgi:hypothetical protein
MAQNIPTSLLQTAQQQYSQGTAAPTTVPLQTEQEEDGSSLGVLKGMMASGGQAQKLARERTAENQKNLQRLLSQTDTGFQGLLQTLAIGAGSKLGEKYSEDDEEMLRAKAVDSSLEELDANDPKRALILAQSAMNDGRVQEGAQYLKVYETLNEEVTNKNIAGEVSSFTQSVQDISTKEEANRLLMKAASTPHLQKFVAPLEKAMDANFPATEKGNRESYGLVKLPDGRTVMAFSSDTEGVGYIETGGTFTRIDPTTVDVIPSGATSSNPKQYDFPDGTRRDTFFDKLTRKQSYFDDDNNLQIVPVEATESLSKMQSSPAELRKVQDDLIQSKNQIRSLSTYLEKRGDARQGFLALADSFTSKVKTLVGSDLTEEEFDLAVAEGRFQGLIGQVRVETVGGGVMTEQDALRIIYRLGGIGAFSNKEVVADAIRDILKMKADTYYNNAAHSNMMRDSNPTYAKHFAAEDTDAFGDEYLSFMLPKQEEQQTPDSNVYPEGFRKVISDGVAYILDDNNKSLMTEEEYRNKQNESGN